MEKEKREIGMEKIVNLLNEYEVERKDGGKWDILDIAIVEKLRCLAISKSYGFIQWLVENKKLKWTDKMEMRKIMLGMPEKQDYYIMMLAVTPEPIEFLVSILK